MDVIVITYNRRDIVRESIKRIKKYNFRIILVHHGLFPIDDIDYDVEVEVKGGYAVSVNRGMEHTNSEYVLVMNDDVFLSGNEWFNMENRLQEINPHFAGFRLLYSDGTFHHSVGKYPPTFISILREELRLMSLPGILSSRKSYERHRGTFYPIYLHKLDGKIGHTIGALFAVKRDSFIKSGMMDEEYQLFFEESDLWKKFYQKGWWGYYFPEFLAYHIHGASHKNEMMDVFYSSMVRYVKKWYGTKKGEIIEWIVKTRRKLKR